MLGGGAVLFAINDEALRSSARRVHPMHSWTRVFP